MKSKETEVVRYLDRFAFCGRQIDDPPDPGLGLVVVVPCHDEMDLNGALKSLWRCERPKCAVEVIVVINSSIDSPAHVRQQNLNILATTGEWIVDRRDPCFRFHLLHFPDLPSRHAGVGLARKIGMDEAVRRLSDAGRPDDGIIACFDADCRCASNYLDAIERHFAGNPDSPGCAIHYEHPLSESTARTVGFMGNEREGKGDIFRAVGAYELHLRYHVRAQHWAGFPYAFHTIGSAMAARCGAYQKQGGMNKRKAGEDFYFLQKISWLGGLTRLTKTTVFPSPRVSKRVPFGTGKAVGDYLKRGDGSMDTYPLASYMEVKWLIGKVVTLWKGGFQEGPPRALGAFLGNDFEAVVMPELRGNVASLHAFRKRFFRWFNAFRLMKFLNSARDQFYPPAPLLGEARALLEKVGAGGGTVNSQAELLGKYRELDRTNGY